MRAAYVKSGAGLAGLILALAGIALESRALVWVAIGVLGVSVVVRLVLARSGQGRSGG